jgi:hypothetical protein
MVNDKVEEKSDLSNFSEGRVRKVHLQRSEKLIELQQPVANY